MTDQPASPRSPDRIALAAFVFAVVPGAGNFVALHANAARRDRRGEAAARGGPQRSVELQTSHWPHLENPVALADARSPFLLDVTDHQEDP